MQDNSNKKEKTDSVLPSKTIDKYEVDEHIVSYYESIGQQIWIGPVMVNFRRLQVSLTNMQKNKMCKVMLFTSAVQSEGKSTIALNTAIMLSSDNKSKVVIVDCDFRKPAVSTMLGFSPEVGLPDYLSEKTKIKDISFNGIVPGLTIIPVGKKPSNTCELFASDRMKQYVSYLKERFDYVIIDSPPVLSFPDSAILAPLSDGVVFVINSKKTKKSVVKRAVETLHDCKIIGIIMNRSEVVANDYYGYSSSIYNYDDTKS
jgi:capsular exopolysaccharide synthesis family protein